MANDSNNIETSEAIQNTNQLPNADLWKVLLREIFKQIFQIYREKKR